MTQSDQVTRYRDLALGRERVESRLQHTLSEFLNAEIAMRVVTNQKQAMMWLQSTFLWVCIQRNPGQYLQGNFSKFADTAQLLEAAKHQLIGASLQKLKESHLAELRPDGSIAPSDPGRCFVHKMASTTSTLQMQTSRGNQGGFLFLRAG
jgi:hypothetical protein